MEEPMMEKLIVETSKKQKAELQVQWHTNDVLFAAGDLISSRIEELACAGIHCEEDSSAVIALCNAFNALHAYLKDSGQVPSKDAATGAA
jgi:hypothetical protein